MKRWLPLLILIAFFLCWNSEEVNAATVTVNPVYATHANDHSAGGYVYSDQSTKKVTINIAANPGFTIKNLYWEKEDGTLLRSAPGAWSGKESYVGEDTISGTPLMVKTVDSLSWGGIYYWDRSGGSNLWRATANNIRYDNSSTCPSAPADKWGYKAYPNCTDDLLSLKLTKAGAYYVNGNPSSPALPDKVVDISTVKPVDIAVDPTRRVDNTVHGGHGYADPSTQYLNRFEVESKNSIRVYFQQTFGNNSLDKEYYKDWANPGARQMWWYSAFLFRFEATTYQYKDKRLVVEWQSKSNEVTTLNVRHMVRTGPTGSFAKAGESVTPFAEALPFTRTVYAETTHGTVVGRNVSYSSYSNTVQSGNSITANFSSSQKNAYVTFFYEKPAPAFTGDFDIVPNTINYRESFAFVPKNFVMNGCTYQSHRYKIERNGSFTTSPVSGMTASTSYSYSTYPWIIGVGGHTVSINIKTTCGESGWINHKTLTVNDMAGNNPPRFQIGFVLPNAQTRPVHEVVEGTIMNLIYIEDPSVPTPIDPDGDSLHFMGFDTESGNQFIKSLPQRFSEYTNGFHNVVMDTLGYHYVSAQMRDQWGLASTASTYIKVIPKNPVAVALCPPVVKSGRNVANSLFDATRSYSPVGRTIDHAKNEWTNKKTVYMNETELNTIETVQLHVYDSTGLKSLDPGVCQLIVEPDLPPVAKLEVPGIAIRNQEIDIYNRSYSPDNDKIVTAEYKYKYDAANDGFENDEWISINANSVLSFKFKPSKVGKYLFYVKVTEDYGKSDDTLDEEVKMLTMDVINDAPTISFDLEGKNQQPDLEPFSIISPSEMINWPVYVYNDSNLVYDKSKLWRALGDKLVAGEGKNFGPQQQHIYYFSQTRNNNSYSSVEAAPFPNNGFGNNRLSPYRSATNTTTYSFPLVDMKYKKDLLKIYPSPSNSSLEKTKIRSNKKNIFYMMDRSTWNYVGDYLELQYDWQIYALNPRNLAPVEQYYEPYAFYPNYKYAGNSDPNDYVISKPSSHSRIFDGVSRSFSSQSLNDWELADGRYLYLSISWKYLNGYDSDGDPNYSYVNELAVYDALNGQKIRSSLDLPTQERQGLVFGRFSHTKGANLVTANSNTSGELTWVEISPELQVVKRVTHQAPEPLYLAKGYDRKKLRYNWSPTNRYMVDHTGAIYSYQYWQGEAANQIFELNVTKFNPDYTLAWRSYVSPTTMSMLTKENTYFGAFSYSDTNSSLAFDYATNEVLAKSYFEEYLPGNVVPHTFEDVVVINAKTGVIKTKKSTRNNDNLDLYHYGMRKFDAPPKYTFDWKPRTLGLPGTTTIEGNVTRYNETCTNGSYNTGSHPVYNAAGEIVGYAGVPCNYKNNIFAEYMMDGVFVSMTASQYIDLPSSMNLNVSIGPPSTTDKLFEPFTNGQFISTLEMSNADVRFNFQMTERTYDEQWFGYSFRMADSKNRYSLETDGRDIVIAKYVNGVRTVLNSSSYPMQDKQDYNIRLVFSGEKIDVWLNQIPILSAEDSEYNNGFFGYWANKSYVTFSQLQYKLLEVAETWSTQYAIWEEDEAAATIRTDNVIFDDPEEDPIAKLGWSLFHTVRFINNQGLSGLHNKSIGDGDLLLDKVGDYKIALKGRDDPHPDYLMPEMTFDEYRKDSNEFVRNITVHRRPIADFDVVQRESDGLILWTDRSHDPDRYESATHYSDEDTGIDYRATKGIMEKRFYYITPGGEYIAEKIVTPQEAGQYEIGLAVKDEYGAWSNWAVRILDVGKIAVPNTPPVPGFTKSHTTTYRGVTVTINSTASDQEDGGRENLPHTYYVRNKTENSGETIRSNSRTSWTTTFDKLGTYTIRQLVEDSAGANAQTQQDIVIVNRKPTANITVPASTNQNAPTKMTVFRPEFRWTYNDPDSDKQHRFQVQIYRYGGYLVHDSDVLDGNEVAWKPGVDLPEKTNMYVQVRVHDGFEWGNWSTVKYFYIETNQPPTADFTWSPSPVYEGDTVTFRTVVADPDRDPLTIQYELTNPSGAKQSFSYTFNHPYPTTGPVQRLTTVGTWRMRLTVSDGKAPAVSVEKNVTVLPLNVTGMVTHTPQWEEYRKAYNLKKSGTSSSPRGTNLFWAGEKFILGADTTTTNTATRANRVEVSMKTFNSSLSTSNSANTRWTGDMWEESFEKLANGTIKFVFTAYYNNGTVKTDEVDVVISGNIYDFFRSHRIE